MRFFNSSKVNETRSSETPADRYVKRVNDQVRENRVKYLQNQEKDIDDLIKARIDLLVQKRVEEIVEQRVIEALRKHSNH